MSLSSSERRFGELRSILQEAPGEAALDRLVRCTLEAEAEAREEVAERWAPYIAANIERWYAQRPYAPRCVPELTGWDHDDPLMAQPYQTNWMLERASSILCCMRGIWSQRRELEPLLLAAMARGDLDRVEGIVAGYVVDGMALVAGLARLPRLRGLMLHDSAGMDQAACEALCASGVVGRLEALQLMASGDATLAHKLADALEGGPMRHLSVTLPKIGGESTRGILGGCARLESLTLCYEGLEADVFDALPPHQMLRSLELNMAGVSAAHIEALADWEGLCGLESLHLAMSQAGDAGLTALMRGVMPSRALRALTLRGMGITDDGVTRYAVEGLCRLERLVLSSNRLGARTMEAMVGRAWPTLRHLELSFNGLDGESIAPLICGLSQLPALEELHLMGNPLGDDAALALIEALPPTVKHVQLGDVGATDALAHKLVDHPKLWQLDYLGLAQNEMTEVGIEALRGSIHALHMTLRLG